MKSIITGAAALFFAAAVSAEAAPAIPPDVSHYMVIIATSTTGGPNSVQMTVLTFPSERACAAAAAIFSQPVEGAHVVARCAPKQ